VPHPRGNTANAITAYCSAAAASTSAFTPFNVPTVPQIAITPFAFPAEGPGAKSTPKVLTRAQRLPGVRSNGRGRGRGPSGDRDMTATRPSGSSPSEPLGEEGVEQKRCALVVPLDVPFVRE
jgi:hypothetical protein